MVLRGSPDVFHVLVVLVTFQVNPGILSECTLSSARSGQIHEIMARGIDGDDRRAMIPTVAGA
jgi:hypothetical protein